MNSEIRREMETVVYDVFADNGGRLVSSILVTVDSSDDALALDRTIRERVRHFEDYHGTVHHEKRTALPMTDNQGKRWRVPE